jgi:hypothetical protein
MLASSAVKASFDVFTFGHGRPRGMLASSAAQAARWRRCVMQL